MNGSAGTCTVCTLDLFETRRRLSVKTSMRGYPSTSLSTLRIPVSTCPVTRSNRELSSGSYSKTEIAEDRNNLQGFYEAFGKNSKLSIDEDAQDSKLG
jgi:hypothetical protein